MTKPDLSRIWTANRRGAWIRWAGAGGGAPHKKTLGQSRLNRGSASKPKQKRSSELGRNSCLRWGESIEGSPGLWRPGSPPPTQQRSFLLLPSGAFLDRPRSAWPPLPASSLLLLEVPRAAPNLILFPCAQHHDSMRRPAFPEEKC